MFKGECGPQSHHIDRGVVEMIFVVLIVVEVVARETVTAGVMWMVLRRVRNEVLPVGVGPGCRRLGWRRLGANILPSSIFIFVR